MNHKHKESAHDYHTQRKTQKTSKNTTQKPIQFHLPTNRYHIAILFLLSVFIASVISASKALFESLSYFNIFENLFNNSQGANIEAYTQLTYSLSTAQTGLLPAFIALASAIALFIIVEINFVKNDFKSTIYSILLILATTASTFICVGLLMAVQLSSLPSVTTGVDNNSSTQARWNIDEKTMIANDSLSPELQAIDDERYK